MKLKLVILFFLVTISQNIEAQYIGADMQDFYEEVTYMLVHSDRDPNTQIIVSFNGYQDPGKPDNKWEEKHTFTFLNDSVFEEKSSIFRSKWYGVIRENGILEYDIKSRLAIPERQFDSIDTKGYYVQNSKLGKDTKLVRMEKFDNKNRTTEQLEFYVDSTINIRLTLNKYITDQIQVEKQFSIESSDTVLLNEMYIHQPEFNYQNSLTDTLKLTLYENEGPRTIDIWTVKEYKYTPEKRFSYVSISLYYYAEKEWSQRSEMKVFYKKKKKGRR